MTTGATTLRPPRHRFDDRTVPWWRLQGLLLTAAPVLPLGVLGVLLEATRTWLLVPAAVLAVVGLTLSLVLPAWWHRFHRWEVTDHAVYSQGGYFWRTSRIAPLSRIQTVDTTRGPLQRTFGLATVVVTTASSAGAVKLVGLDSARADDLSADLTRLTQATPGDAT